MDHLVLSAEAFINEVPENLEAAKSRSDYKHWKRAVDEEMKALEQNKTWILVQKPENAKLIDSK